MSNWTPICRANSVGLTVPTSDITGSVPALRDQSVHAKPFHYHKIRRLRHLPALWLASAHQSPWQMVRSLRNKGWDEPFLRRRHQHPAMTSRSEIGEIIWCSSHSIDTYCIKAVQTADHTCAYVRRISPLIASTWSRANHSAHTH